MYYGMFEAFFRRKPTFLAYRFAVFLAFVIPLVWLYDEAGFSAQMTLDRAPYENPATWFRVSDPGMEVYESWCIISLSEINPETALTIAKKTQMVSDDGFISDFGVNMISIKDVYGCNGSDSRRMFWLAYGETQAQHRANYITENLIHWLARFIYMYFMILALINIRNKWYAQMSNTYIHLKVPNYSKKKGFLVNCVKDLLTRNRG